MKIRGNTVGTTLKPENAILKASGLTEAQKAQARENIGVNDYYSTKREALAVTLGIEGATASNVTSTSIWGLYDALMAAYPDKVQRKEVHNDDGTFTNYEYVISTGDYNEVVGSFNEKDDNVKKPKYLVMSGIHGYEKPAVVSTYRLFRDIVTGHNIPAQFREGCVLHFLPVANPWGLDNDKRYNEKDVDINRNFDWNHGVNVQEDKADNIGDNGNSEKETQAIVKWLDANKDAQLLLDCHNMSPGRNEIVTFVGLTDSEEYITWKKIAMRGIDRVIPFWKDVIGYSSQTIFRNSASLNEGGLAVFYASEVLNIPSLGLEMSVFPTGNETARDEMAPETIAVAAEVIGNTLMEFYKQYEVVDMTEVNEKLDALLRSASFRVESSVEDGVYTVAEEDYLAGKEYCQTVRIPCSSGAKVLILTPTKETYDEILWNPDGTLTHAQGPVVLGVVGQALVQLPYQAQYKDGVIQEKLRYMGYVSLIKNVTTGNTVQIPNYHYCYCDNTDGFSIECAGFKAGNYNWTAYYWND